MITVTVCDSEMPFTVVAVIIAVPGERGRTTTRVLSVPTSTLATLGLLEVQVKVGSARSGNTDVTIVI